MTDYIRCKPNNYQTCQGGRLVASLAFVLLIACGHEGISERITSCCDPSTQPVDGIEGYQCCDDGTWILNSGGGYLPGSCGPSAGPGEICTQGCDLAVVGQSCSDEGRVCSDSANNACEGLEQRVCLSGTWQLEQPEPVACFDCGALQCETYTEYCEMTTAGVVGEVGGDTHTVHCVEFPQGCNYDDGCSCLESALSWFGLSSCTGEPGEGFQVTLQGS